MVAYGTSFRRLREQRGFQIKEVYSEILSRTTAYRFELGENEISAEKLVCLLERIGIFSLDEFIYLHQQFFDLPPINLDLSVSQIIQGELDNSFQTQKSESLAFYEQHRNSRKKEEKFYAYLAHYHFLTNLQQQFELPIEFAKEYQFMQDYLLSIETWALRELENFSFLSACFSSNARQALLPRFKNNFYRYQTYFDDWADKYVLHLVNFSMNTVLKKEFQSLPSELKEISKMMEQYPRLKWQVVHLVRYLYIQILVAAIEEQPERLQIKFQRLKAFKRGLS